MDVSTLVKLPANPAVPQVSPGDTVKVRLRVIEGEKQRSQVFQGTVIRTRRGGNGASFTVRRVTHGIGVERTFMVHSPLLEKVEVVRRGKVRRAKLYYLRNLSTREARLKERTTARGEETAAAEVVETVMAAAEAETEDADTQAAVKGESSGQAEVEMEARAEATKVEEEMGGEGEQDEREGASAERT
jgi:large subunit ribosomal protein L19